MKRLLCGWVSLVLLLCGVGRAQADYIFTTIDVPNALGGTGARGINDAGQIVGVYGDANGIPHSFLYSGGQYTTLDAGVSDHLTEACGINASEQVVGSVFPLSIRQPVSGFLYAGGTYTLLNRPGAVSTSAYGINDAGQIVGNYSFTTSGLGPGFLLSGGKYTSINWPGASYTQPYGINNSGQIVGQWSTGATAGSFLLSGGKYTDLELPGHPMSFAAAGINDAGQIVGTYYPAEGGTHGVLLSGGSYSMFDVPGSLDTFVYGINNAGQIVGEYEDANHNTHGFLATPTPEPSTLVLVGIASLSLLGWAWRRPRKAVN